MAESERKYEDIARKLATMEGELERSSDRCSAGKISLNSETIALCGNTSFIVLKLYFVYACI